MRFKTTYKKFYAYIFLFLFLSYYGSVSLFYHTHIIDGGFTITHSHPFKTSTGGLPTHAHSENQYITVHLLSLFLITLLVISQALILINRPVKRIISENYSVPHSRSVRYLYLLRAPPSL